MGTEYSCVKPLGDLDGATLSASPRPALLLNNTIIVPNPNLLAVPPAHSPKESVIYFQEENPVKKVFQRVDLWSKQKTNDVDPTKDDSRELFKKTTSFFRLSSLDSRYQADPTEYANDQNRSDWKLQNIKLEKLINMSQDRVKYLWEAFNTVTQKRCTVKILLFEKSKLTHGNYFQAERILRNLAEIQSTNVITIYSFSMFETEVQNKLCLAVVVVQEPARCSLKDIDTLFVKKKNIWTKDQLLVIIRDIYNGLVVCKEKQLTHGRIVMENVLLSESSEKIVIADLDFRLPLVNENRTTSSRVSILKSDQSSFLTPDAADKMSMPDENDISDLTAMILRMITNDEKSMLVLKTVRKDEKYRQPYCKVFEALDLVNQRNRTITQILSDLEALTKQGNDKFTFSAQYNFETKYQNESQVALLFLKLDCYDILNQRNTALEACLELIEIFEKKENKTPQDFQEYIKCVNCAIKYNLAMKDWLKARDLSVHLGSAVKKDQHFKSAMRANPKEYVNFTFLLGNISEGLGEPDKAIALYAKGLAYCDVQLPGLEAYSSTLKRISNLYMQKNQQTKALDCLKKLVDFYETREGYYVDRADSYLNMGDIFTQQGNLGEGVKLYLKSLDNIKKGRMNSNGVMLNIIEKIIGNYKSLHEEEKALRYRRDSLELKRRIFGKDSDEFMEEIKEVAAAHAGLGHYEAALNHYLVFQKVAISDAGNKQQYLESLLHAGDMYAELKDYDNAKKSFETYANLQKEAKGVESKEYLVSQDKLASVFYREGKVVPSVKIQLETLPIKEKILNPDDLYLVVSLNNLGDTYFASDDYAKALKYHKSSLDRLKDRQNEFREECSQLYLRIAMDYHKCGKSGKALKAVNQSFQISKGDGFEPTMNCIVEMYDLLSKTSEIMQKGLDFLKLTKQLAL